MSLLKSLVKTASDSLNWFERYNSSKYEKNLILNFKNNLFNLLSKTLTFKNMTMFFSSFMFHVHYHRFIIVTFYGK